jgi:hypothetical protein
VRKSILAVGLIVVIAGVALAVFSTRESYTTAEELSVWYPIYTQNPADYSTLSPASEPYNRTFWGYGPMPFNGLLELNIATTGPVRVLVSFIVGQDVVDVVYDVTGTMFEGKSIPAGGGTYQVEIRNEGSESVRIYSGSNVRAMADKTDYVTVYPYTNLGGLVAAVGVILLVLGLVIKPRRKARKR